MLIINPVSGTKKIQRMIHRIVRTFMDAGYLPTVLVTSKRGDAFDFAASYGADHDLLIAAGGDGTLNEVVSGMRYAGLTKPVGYIPCGSTNEFAEAYGIPSDPASAAILAANGPQKNFDLGSFGGRVFLSSAIFGAFTWMGYTTDQELKNNLGPTAYVLEGVLDPEGKNKPYHVKFDIDGRVYEDNYIFGAISNAPSLAGIFQYPDDYVMLDDGLLEVFLIRNPKNLSEAQTLLHSLITRDYKCPMIELVHAKRIFIENHEGLIWSLDGESSGIVENTEVSVIRGGLVLKG